MNHRPQHSRSWKGALATISVTILSCLGVVSPVRAAFHPGSVQTISTVNLPRSAAFGDLNNDGIQDMVVTSDGNGGIQVFRGNADSTYTNMGSSIGSGAMGPPVLADFNNDGKLDVAVPFLFNSSYYILVLQGNGDFTWGGSWFFNAPAHPEVVVARDFNNDGKMDLATIGYASISTGTVRVFLNTTTSFVNFASTDYAVGAQPRGIASANVTAGSYNPSTVDLITANFGGGSITILKNDGTGHFGNRLDVATQVSCFAVTTSWMYGALDRPQIITANRDSATVTLLYYDTATSTWKKSNYATAAGPRSVSVGDVDGDANPDVLVSCYSGNVISVLATDGYAALLQPRYDVPVGNNPYMATIINKDADIKPDLLTVDHGSNQVRITHGLPGVGWGVGDTIPDFAAQNQYNDTFHMSKMVGKYVLLDLCSVWCTPCKQMAKHTEGLYATWAHHPTVHFDYVTGLIDTGVYGTPSTQADATWWASQFGINRPILHSSNSLAAGVRAVASASKLAATPTLRLIDPSGVIVWINLGALEDSTISRVLANAAGVAIPPDVGAPSTTGMNLNVTYGPNNVSWPADDLAPPTFFFLIPPGTFGENFYAQMNMYRDWLGGTEEWDLRWIYSPYAGAPDMPPNTMGSAYPWQFTLSNLALDATPRTIPPGAVAHITLEDWDGNYVQDYATVPVSLSGNTLTMGAIPASVIAAAPMNIYALNFAITMQVGAITATEPRPLPRTLEMRSPWPNPAAGSSHVAWSQPRAGAAKLDVYDVSGRHVRTLVDGTRSAGENRADWNLTDAGGNRVGAGLYFVRLAVEGMGVKTTRVTVVR